MLKTIIIDDEQNSRNVMQVLLQESGCPIELAAVCSNAPDGIKAIIEHSPDLVFLDIDMPLMNGFELLDCVKNLHPRIIFVTAHNQYAIQAFRYSALDYLLKPVGKADLQAALQKAMREKDQEEMSTQYHIFLNQIKTKDQAPEVIALPVADGLMFTKVQDISYCRADRNYTTIHFSNGEKTLVSRSLKEFETLLDSNRFFRVHHSALVNLNLVKRYVRGDGGYVIMHDNNSIEVSRQRKEEFMKTLNKV